MNAQTEEAKNCLAGLAENIRLRREQLMLSQADLAKRLGCDQSYVSKLENGAKQPLVSTLADLANALEIQPSDLLATTPGKILRK